MHSSTWDYLARWQDWDLTWGSITPSPVSFLDHWLSCYTGFLHSPGTAQTKIKLIMVYWSPLVQTDLCPVTLLFFFSSPTLFLPTHLPPALYIHAQSCNPMDCSPSGSSVHGLFQARILEWVAISFSTVTLFKGRITYTEESWALVTF